jgi:hypothetical protein
LRIATSSSPIVFQYLNPVFNAPGRQHRPGPGAQVSSTLNNNRIVELALKFYF